MSEVKRGAEANYPVLNLDELCKLPIQKLADPTGCLLACWTPSSLLDQGLTVLKAWGFELKQTFIWGKIKNPSSKPISDPNDMLGFGMGRLFRNCHEICLIGTNNNGIYKKLENRSQRTVCFDYNFKHSKKTEMLQDRLDIMFPFSNKLELFGRRKREGWLVLGNEVCDGEDIRDSLNKLFVEEQAA